MAEDHHREGPDINIREIATEIILDHARDVEHLTIHERLGDYGLTPEDEHKHSMEIHELIDKATVTVELPAETAS